MQVSAAILMKLVMTHIKQDVVSPGGEVNFSYIFVELLSCLLKRFRYDSIVKQKLWLRWVWLVVFHCQDSANSVKPNNKLVTIVCVFV